jgi:hypothetical protein
VPPSAPVKNLEPDREVAASCLLVAHSVPNKYRSAHSVPFVAAPFWQPWLCSRARQNQRKETREKNPIRTKTTKCNENGWRHTCAAKTSLLSVLGLGGGQELEAGWGAAPLLPRGQGSRIKSAQIALILLNPSISTQERPREQPRAEKVSPALLVIDLKAAKGIEKRKSRRWSNPDKNIPK